MEFETLEDIYEMNGAYRTRLLEIISDLSADDAALPTANGKWTLAKVVEHLAAVEYGMMQIAGRLLGKSEDQGLMSDGDVTLSPAFVEGLAKVTAEKTKLEAPEVVQPEGGQSIPDSISKLNSNREKLEAMKKLFERYDGRAATFPHAAFGPLTAIDWLALIGLHELRHTKQIKEILSKKNAANG
jgi:hypothetical protein